MSLFGAKTNIKQLEKELAAKKGKLSQLTEEFKIQSIDILDTDTKPLAKSKPVWRELHRKRNALMFHNYSV